MYILINGEGTSSKRSFCCVQTKEAKIMLGKAALAMAEPRDLILFGIWKLRSRKTSFFGAAIKNDCVLKSSAKQKFVSMDQMS